MVAALAVALLAGCGSSPAARLHFGMDDAPEGRRVLFPAAPDVPRYLYAGQLTGEANFKRENDEGSGVAGVLRWLVGLVAGEATPLVLQRPQSGVVDEDGRILVTDVSRAAVFVFDDKAGELRIWEHAEGLKRFRSPIGIALGPEGQVFVADAELGMVARLDANGNSLRAIGKGVAQAAHRRRDDATRSACTVADTYAHDVKVFDRGAPGSAPSATAAMPARINSISPPYVALRNDELYVTDTMNARVLVFEAETGHPLRHIGERGLPRRQSGAA